jgi:hypothetical protein
MELGCRVIASRTRAFIELSSYFPDQIELFDIGNFMELATRIATPADRHATGHPSRYSVHTNAKLYLQAMGMDVDL